MSPRSPLRISLVFPPFEDRLLEKRLDRLLKGDVDLEIRKLSVSPKSVLRVQCE